MAIQHILLIDDDEVDHEFFLAALQRAGVNIKYSLYTDAREALALLAAGKLRPDLILLDLNMPVMNGQQFLITVKENQSTKDIPVIILSTSSHKTTIKLTLELGAKDFITKPDRLENLVACIKEILAEK